LVAFHPFLFYLLPVVLLSPHPHRWLKIEAKGFACWHLKPFVCLTRTTCLALREEALYKAAP